MADYAELQAEHQRLLHQMDEQGDPARLVAAVQAYVARVRAESGAISAPRDRDQLRANLRFWGAFLFDRTGEYPDTTLRPAEGGPVTTPIVKPDSQTGGPAGQPPTPPPGPSRTGCLIALAVVGVIAIGGVLVALALSAGLGLLPGAKPPTVTPTPRFNPSSVAPATPTPTEPNSGVTPEASATQAALQTDTTVPTALPSATPTGTAEPTHTPGPTPGGPPFKRFQMLAQVQQTAGPAGCANRSLNIALANAAGLTRDQLAGGQVQLSLPGGDVVASQPLDPEKNVLDLTQLGAGEDNTLLLRIEHPKLSFASVIVQYSPDCSGNQTTVTYVGQIAPSYVAAEPPRNPNLSLAWQLVTWGPDPRDPKRWVAEVQLEGQGGDGQFIFWDGETYARNPTLLFAQTGCEPGRRLVGVSSGGQAVLREIVLQAPTC